MKNCYSLSSKIVTTASRKQTEPSHYLLSFPCTELQSAVILTKCVYSRLSRIRQNSLELGLATMTQNFARLSVPKYLEIAENNPNVASSAPGAEEQQVTDLNPGSVYMAQSDPPNSSQNWIVPRKKPTLRRTVKLSKSVMEGFLGSVRATSSTVLQTSRQTRELTRDREQDQYEYETSYTISPPPWLVRLGFHYGLHLGFLSSTTQRWKNTLKTFCPVPDDALIFEFCKQGNVPAVMSLLSRGHASVRDTNSRGLTPLHVSLIWENDPTKYMSFFM